MGKSFGGVFANWYGKVGNVVGRVREGRTILSIYQPKVKNPNTTSQQNVRSDFALMTKTLSPMTAFLKEGFHDLDGYKTGNPFSAAVGFNLKRDDVITENQGVKIIDYSKLMISQGSLDLPYSPSATADSSVMSMTWADNSGMGNAEASDKVMLCVYCPYFGQAIVNTSLAERSQRNATVSLPPIWTGREIEVWIAMASTTKKAWSDSTHVATLSL